jgi:hypothetical protein
VQPRTGGNRQNGGCPWADVANKFGRTALDYAKGITGTNTIATIADIRAAADKGTISQDESYYLLARKGSGRDFNCVLKALEDYQRRFKTKPEAK